jgi:biopolymer transport protein ExbB
MDALHWWRQGDAVTQGTALILLAMSVASWVVIVWKLRLMHRAGVDVARCTAAFWQAPSLGLAEQRLKSFDRHALVLPLVAAANSIAAHPDAVVQPTLAASGSLSQRLTRVLRDALHQVLGRLQFGQVLLATVGSTAPFVGLLGTVWGIYHALTAMAGAGQITIDRVSGPVGEALVMTAAGLAVAIPAVLAYNVFGRLIGRIEADLEGFARDVRELLIDTASAQSLAGTTESQSSVSRPAAGPPQGGSAPLGGSEPRAAGSGGA